MLATPYQQYIHLSRYSRWNEDAGRRETWEETVKRYTGFWHKHLQSIGKLDEETAETLVKVEDAILNLKVMPSMRALMTAGSALERDHMAGYNCSFVAIDNPRAFDEIMYILMCGTGVGFSVEKKNVSKLPEVAEEFSETETVITVADSRIGWAGSFRQLLALLYAGQIPSWDTSKVRPAGTRLKTFGGRASGPEPLVRLFKYTVQVFKNAAGRKLTTLEVHDLACTIADIVIVGGVRRSALISISDLDDPLMRHAKYGEWWTQNGQRKLANNSAAYNERPDFETFLNEWQTLYVSKSGERGIFNRKAAIAKALENGRRSAADFGTNPCAEILLRSMGLCNLTEVVIRPNDSTKSIREKVKLATILGTFQSLLTDFRYVRKQWKQNAEEERLLGVSLTGIVDNIDMISDQPEFKKFLRDLKQLAIDTNAYWADKLGIAHSAAITCVKPSGTVSQLVNSASGIHPRYNTYYIRRVMGDLKDPITKFLIAAGVPYEKSAYGGDNMVFEFPVKTVEGALTRKSVDAYKQLELYMTYRTHWCEHNPSTTVYYGDDNYLGVGQWVWENFDSIGGVALLPTDNGVYAQAPYEDITKEQYEERVSKFPKLNWEDLALFEREDSTKSTQDLACSAGVCEI